MKQIKISDEVAKILDRVRGEKQKTYSEAIVSFFPKNIERNALQKIVRRLQGK